MIIKKEITRLHHPSPAKGSSFSFKKYQDLLNDSDLSPSPKMITRSNSTILQPSIVVRRNSTPEVVAARRRHASKEMVRRALTPPARRLTWRWFVFQPTPSRLSVMSMAI